MTSLRCSCCYSSFPPLPRPPPALIRLHYPERLSTVTVILLVVRYDCYVASDHQEAACLLYSDLCAAMGGVIVWCPCWIFWLLVSLDSTKIFAAFHWLTLYDSGTKLQIAFVLLSPGGSLCLWTLLQRKMSSLQGFRHHVGYRVQVWKTAKYNKVIKKSKIWYSVLVNHKKMHSFTSRITSLQGFTSHRMLFTAHEREVGITQRKERVETLSVWTAVGSGTATSVNVVVGALTFVWWRPRLKEQSEHWCRNTQPWLTAPLWGTEPRRSQTRRPPCVGCSSLPVFHSDILTDPSHWLTGLNLEQLLRIRRGRFGFIWPNLDS